MNELRLANAELVGKASGVLSEFFWSYAGADPVELKNAVLAIFPEIVADFGDVNAMMAAEFFDEMRAEAGARGGYSARPAAPPGREQAEGAARWAVQPAFAGDWDMALAQLIQASERLIRSAGRETIAGSALEDRAASGYQRVTRPGSCSFCRMLADRGGVYMRGTAYFASHDNCKCEVVPSWERDPRPVGVAQYRASERTSNMSPEQLQAHRARIRAYIAEHYDPSR